MKCGTTTSLIVMTSLAISYGYVTLQPKAYTQLRDFDDRTSMGASTYNRLDFDYYYGILYVTAKEPGRLTAYTLVVDGSPTLHAQIVFNISLTGRPLDVEFCRPTESRVPLLAISFEGPSSISSAGTVTFFHALSLLHTELTPIRSVTVGPEPVDMKFADNCRMLVVANRGRASKNGNTYRDPEGTLTKIILPPDFSEHSGVTSTTIRFDSVFTGPGSDEYLQLLMEDNFRYVPKRDAEGNILTVTQGLEPHHLVISPDFTTAYVSLPSNNAVARVNLNIDQVSAFFPMGNRSWTDYYMDASDTDHEVNMSRYSIYSLLQPTQMAWLSKDGSDWLVMLDTGSMSDVPVLNYTDFERAKTLMQAGRKKPDFKCQIVAALRQMYQMQEMFEKKNPLGFRVGPSMWQGIDPSHSELRAQLLDDKELGRLWVSTEDGLRNSDGKIEQVMAFGGRGFSIRNANNLRTVSTVVDNLEQVTKQYHKRVFNTAYLSDASTPETDVEATSPSYGTNLGAMALGTLMGKTVMFLGSATSGIVYVYQLSPDTECPQPVFHSLIRAGTTGISWGHAFGNSNVGDIGITDMKYLSGDRLKPVLVVTSATSNSVSIYSVVDTPFDPPIH